MRTDIIPIGDGIFYSTYDDGSGRPGYEAFLEINGNYYSLGCISQYALEYGEITRQYAVDMINRQIDDKHEFTPYSLMIVAALLPDRLEDAKAADASYHARIEENRRHYEEKQRQQEEAKRKRLQEDARHIEHLQSIGMLRTGLTKLQYGLAVAALDVRYWAYRDDNNKEWTVDTLFNLITKYGYTEVHRSTRIWNKYGERIARPKRKYYLFAPGRNIGVANVDGRFFALCNIDPQHDNEY